MIDILLEVIVYCFGILGYFLDEKLRIMHLRRFLSIKLYYVSVVKIADLLKTGFKDISFDVLIDLDELFELCYDLFTNFT